MPTCVFDVHDCKIGAILCTFTSFRLHSPALIKLEAAEVTLVWWSSTESDVL